MSDEQPGLTYVVQIVVAPDGTCMVSIHIVRGQLIMDTLHADGSVNDLQAAAMMAWVLIEAHKKVAPETTTRAVRSVTNATRLAGPAHPTMDC